jgi:antitoxin (DNA-binding transcriptional repressor) of toxin-antitoxin stability system
VERISVTQAAHQFSDLLNRVFYQGASFELERNNKVIARLLPANAPVKVQTKDLNRLFAELPDLQEDAAAFADDVEAVRNELPREQEPWV